MRRDLALAAIAGVSLAGGGVAASRGFDPLEGYFGNTLVCAAGAQGNDLCHTWIERDGTFINIDPGGAHRGHYTRGPVRPDGKVPVCYFYDSDRLVLPAELMGPPPGARQPAGGPGPASASAPAGGPGPAPAGGPGPASAPGPGPMAGPGMPPPGGGVICRTSNFRTTCTRHDDDRGLSASDKIKLHWTIAQRFHAGMCYPLAPKKPGDTWYEDDDPMPSQNGIDKVFLIKGHH